MDGLTHLAADTTMFVTEKDGSTHTTTAGELARADLAAIITAADHYRMGYLDGLAELATVPPHAILRMAVALAAVDRTHKHPDDIATHQGRLDAYCRNCPTCQLHMSPYQGDWYCVHHGALTDLIAR